MKDLTKRILYIVILVVVFILVLIGALRIKDTLEANGSFFFKIIGAILGIFIARKMLKKGRNKVVSILLGIATFIGCCALAIIPAMRLVGGVLVAIVLALFAVIIVVELMAPTTGESIKEKHNEHHRDV